MKTPVRITVGSDELSANTRVEQSASIRRLLSPYQGPRADYQFLLLVLIRRRGV